MSRYDSVIQFVESGQKFLKAGIDMTVQLSKMSLEIILNNKLIIETGVVILPVIPFVYNGLDFYGSL